MKRFKWLYFFLFASKIIIASDIKDDFKDNLNEIADIEPSRSCNCFGVFPWIKNALTKKYSHCKDKVYRVFYYLPFKTKTCKKFGRGLFEVGSAAFLYLFKNNVLTKLPTEMVVFTSETRQTLLNMGNGSIYFLAIDGAGRISLAAADAYQDAIEWAKKMDRGDYGNICSGLINLCAVGAIYLMGVAIFPLIPIENLEELLKAWHCENVFPILIVSLTAKGARELYLGLKEWCGCLDIEELNI